MLDFLFTSAESAHFEQLGSVDNFYKAVQTLQKKKLTFSEAEAPSFAGLSTTLREYQCSAVHWMMSKESIKEPEPVAQNELSNRHCNDAGIHILWRRLPLSDGDVYFNPYSGK